MMDNRKLSRELTKIEEHCGQKLWRTRLAIRNRQKRVDVLDALCTDSATIVQIANDTETAIAQLVAKMQTAGIPSAEETSQ